MRVDETERRLHDLLRAAGVDPEAATLAATWNVFREFVHEPVETASDGVLVQGGVYRFYRPERYIFDFLRQVQEPGDDELEQLHCKFEFEPTPELRALGTFTEWWFLDEGRPLDDYLDEIRARPEFEAVVGLTPVRGRIFQEGT
jgi:hypothetical protein